MAPGGGPQWANPNPGQETASLQGQGAMAPGGGPQWANPNPGMGQETVSLHGQQAEFFAPLSTLDEPVLETIMRDVRSVGSKLRVVLLPMDRTVSIIP
jgi:hypothetical protein